MWFNVFVFYLTLIIPLGSIKHRPWTCPEISRGSASITIPNIYIHTIRNTKKYSNIMNNIDIIRKIIKFSNVMNDNVVRDMIKCY